MAEVLFNYRGIDTLIQCKIEDKFKDICEKFSIKSQTELNNLNFIYDGEILNLDLEFNQVANQKDKQNLKMNILVNDKNSTIIDEKEIIKKSKDIICPKCGEIFLINLNDSKTILNDYKNNISLNEFDNIQNINQNKIICNACNNNKNDADNNQFSIFDNDDKNNMGNNQFSIFDNDNKNISLLFKENHNKENIIINSDNNNYLYNKQNESFIPYPDLNKDDLSQKNKFKIKNNNNDIKLYEDILPNINNIKTKIRQLKDLINNFSSNIDDINTIIQNIKMNMEKNYIINNNLFNNYEIFDNDNANIILNDLKDIINDNKINNIFNKICDLNYQVKNIENKNNQIKNIDIQNEIKNNQIINEIHNNNIQNNINILKN